MKKSRSEEYTIAAFLLGYLLIGNLSSTEQNELGNWFMLIGQVLCTNGSFNFSNDWGNHNQNDKRDIKDMLNIVDEGINKVNGMFN